MEGIALYRVEPTADGFDFSRRGLAWSSAGAHCGMAAGDVSLSMELWAANWKRSSWKEYLAEKETEEELQAIRQSTHTGRPLATRASFVIWRQQPSDRYLRKEEAVRQKQPVNSAQAQLTFEI
ncbi:hypothetical protein AB4Y89_23895 [Terriglobus sp. 2YAB30_2]|uniref:hypothetical protein n=1 Tax=Terriglobus sp. YAF25 TaxID=3233080 RepID=UPI003F9AD144